LLVLKKSHRQIKLIIRKNGDYTLTEFKKNVNLIENSALFVD